MPCLGWGVGDGEATTCLVGEAGKVGDGLAIIGVSGDADGGGVAGDIQPGITSARLAAIRKTKTAGDINLLCFHPMLRSLTSTAAIRYVTLVSTTFHNQIINAMTDLPCPVDQVWVVLMEGIETGVLHGGYRSELLYS